MLSWPTDWVSGSLFRQLSDAENYDRSEQIAWQAAKGTRALVRLLNAKYPGKLRILAHSMGSVVASEALQLLTASGSGPIIQTYIASQAASAAHAYDAVHPQNIQFLSETPEVYGNYPVTHAPYFANIAGAGPRILNYHNRVDYALNWWEWNQDFKPDVPWTYSYITGRWYRSPIPGGTVLTFPKDRGEIYARIAEARSRALGSCVDGTYYAGGPVNTPESVDLRGTSFGYGSGALEHSAEFNSTLMSRRSYWTQLLQSILPLE